MDTYTLGRPMLPVVKQGKNISFYHSFFPFPDDVVRLIYEFDPTKRYSMDHVIHQLRMRQVWYNLLWRSGMELVHQVDFDNVLCNKDDVMVFSKWLCTYHSDNPFNRMDTSFFENHVHRKRLWHRVLERKPRLPFRYLVPFLFPLKI